MHPIDVPSTFAVCGAGAGVGAALMRPSLAHDALTAQALRQMQAAYAVIGVGMLHPLLVGSPLPLWSQALLGACAVVGVLMVGWALAPLSGDCVTRGPLAVAIGLLLTLLLAAWPLGTPGMTLVCTLGLCAASMVAAWMGRRMLLRPRDLHERLVGAMILVMVSSSWLRASYLLTWDGPYPQHLLYVPPVLLASLALMYGVLPVVFAMLLMNVVNARLQGRLHQQAMVDPLTGTLSRHALAEGAAQLIGRVRAEGSGLAVLMIDLDHFKLVNDGHGHAGGDAVLRHAVELLRTQLRSDSLLVRFGGEEFVALVPVADLPSARRVAERMREHVESASWHAVLPGLVRVTVSLGVALVAEHESLERALARADEALYRAKRGGRNQVQVALAAA